MRILFGLLGAFALAGCAVQAPAPKAPTPNARPSVERLSDADVQRRATAAARQFVSVIERMEPVAEQVCRERRKDNCDFQIVVDDRPGQPPNAFQTLDRNGRPILAFNLALIASVRNADELAFVVGHEAAHHIARHLDRQRQSATVGAVVLGGVISAITGGDASAVKAGQEIGAAVGARSYSKEFELEADAMGTVITHRAGYDPLRGSEFFTKLPDPGDRFMGTHPPNADRVKTVRRVAASLN
ncbi:M48 family metallopeptidase [Roseobacteraceae bacterium S113]